MGWIVFFACVVSFQNCKHQAEGKIEIVEAMNVVSSVQLEMLIQDADVANLTN